MTGIDIDVEMVNYLLLLLLHGSECETEECPTCLTLQKILAGVRGRIFDNSAHAFVSAARGD